MMNRTVQRLPGLAVAFLFFVSPITLADETVPVAVKDMLARILPGHIEANVEATPLQGLYEVTYGGEVFYLSQDGRFMLRGDLLDMQTMRNLSEERRSAYRLSLLDEIDPARTINYPPADKPARHVIYVFTDIDCPYCRKMHSQMADYNRLGIEMRYLAYPRSGIDTPSYYKAVNVWCAKDPREAMTRAKQGEKLPAKDCDHPIRQDMALADKFGVDGTPTLILSDGSVIPGYVEPERLITFLEQRGGR